MSIKNLWSYFGVYFGVDFRFHLIIQKRWPPSGVYFGVYFRLHSDFSVSFETVTGNR